MSISLLPLINYQLKFISYGKYKFNWFRFCNYPKVAKGDISFIIIYY